MIGRGTIAVRNGDDYELHFVSPFELALVDKELLAMTFREHARVKGYMPDAVVTPDELKLIKDSHSIAEHRFASDVIVSIEER